MFGRAVHSDGSTGLGRGRRLLLLAAMLGLLLIARSAAEAAARWHFSINMTESLPNWAFLIDQADRHPARGELVAFVPPPNRWFASGAVFAKQVAGVPGDRVERHGRDFYVAGRFVGTAKARARDGSVAIPGPVGVIPPGRYFVVTSHPDSLDSRYSAVGWIEAARVIGVARPIL